MMLRECEMACVADEKKQETQDRERTTEERQSTRQHHSSLAKKERKNPQ